MQVHNARARSEHWHIINVLIKKIVIAKFANPILCNKNQNFMQPMLDVLLSATNETILPFDKCIHVL